ncbi:DNA repair protein RAD51 homolog 2-like isoform X2 [Pomacea canaliculata]|uniref:DNA repair protein RAD51 homolog 2-like isoform X2 n=1 Tax=Pomacea canaliculata TaxID=400727 RepID=UPI000D72ADF6|nr:DNA repair protein RAD51 homolog 2-like isoform X2 [Pomacea canaliculata]XP_025104919.1 DNA repair protein RAD51 homolog 2-like isoform X2 [Pomacea canaliculata]XP_025104920.1 DNA repair protein RAD51 homolog 2-like isoform X2 [Pomacea canaliculata]XP_025104921.1 DNA repair protein RAD51 homolog 2-like isoform X2 [Pomacea canaliculata]
MACKRLQRVDIRNDLRDRLLSQDIKSCGDVLCMSSLELMKVTGCCGLTVKEIIQKCSTSAAPAPVIALDMLKRRKQVKGFLSTSFPDLDHVLHGGFPSGTITEIAGPSGCGKTQFCLTLAVLATLPVSNGGCGGTVLFIDTEGAFSAERLVEIARCRLPELFKDDDSLHQLVSNVYIDLIQTCKNLMNRLKNLEEDLISKNVRLLIVDSVASLVRKEFGSLQDGMMRRTDFLTAEAGLLKHIAETFSIPVVVTNQITTRFGITHAQSSDSSSYDKLESGDGKKTLGSSVEMDGEDTYMTAALGNTWSHCVNTRLILQFLPERRRQMLVAKSPVAPFTCFDIIIKDEGVLQDVQGQGHYVGTDPSKQEIKCRRGIAVQTSQW